MKLTIANKISINIANEPLSSIGGKDFSVRKASSVFVDNLYWIFADIVPHSHRYWPETYDTSIGLFRSTDCINWQYEGIILKHRDKKFRFDFGGATTPGAIMFKGQVFLFYAGKENPDGSGKRHILLARAESCNGVFKKRNEPIIESSSEYIHFDDPVAILSENGQQIELYYRYANHKEGFYEIARITSYDGENWSSPITVLKSNKSVRAYETADACRIKIANQSYVLLSAFEHFITGKFKTGMRISIDGLTFSDVDGRCVYIDDYWNKPIPVCGLQTIFISRNIQELEYIGIAGEIDKARHYGIQIYPVHI